MPLPVRTKLADIEAICAYLITKPAGATQAEVAAVLNEKALDRRKLSALKFWGLIEDAGTKLRLSERGARVARDNGAQRASALREVVASIPPYGAVIANAVRRNATVVMAAEVAAHWHQQFGVGAHFGILNHQTVCFFRVAEGADLGRLVVGRKGQQTRFELAEFNARAFVEGASIATSRPGTAGEYGSPSGEAVPPRDDIELQAGESQGRKSRLHHPPEELQDHGAGEGAGGIREVRARRRRGSRGLRKAVPS